MLIKSIKVEKLPHRQRVDGGKINAKVTSMRTRMEHSPQQAGMCSQPHYHVARWYARPENLQFFGPREGVLGGVR